MVNWSELTDKRRTINCARSNGIMHVIESKEASDRYISYCGIIFTWNELLIMRQRPEEITCNSCIEKYALAINEEYDGLVEIIKMSQGRLLDIQDILTTFQNVQGIKINGFALVLQKVTEALPLDSRRGRPRKGRYKTCKSCGKLIYVRPFRDREDGNYCKECAQKLFKPPSRVKGGGRLKAGLQTNLTEKDKCPKCGSHTLERDGTDLHCWACGHVVYHVFNRNS